MTNGSLACEGKGFQEGVHRGKGWEVGGGAREAVVVGASEYRAREVT